MPDEFFTKLCRLNRKAREEQRNIRRAWASAIDAEESCGDWLAVESYLNAAADSADRLAGHIADALDLSRRGQAGEDNIADEDDEDSVADAHED
jgi:hypothetical protein